MLPQIFFLENMFFGIFFHVFLGYSETYEDPSLSEIGAKQNFSSEIFVEKSVPKI